MSEDMVKTLKTDKAILKGDVKRIAQYVDSKILPRVNMTRMTALAVGRDFLKATPEQRSRLQQEYKSLLIRTYSGALSQFKNETVEVLPVRAATNANEVVVRSRIVGRPDPISLDYRMEKAGNDWRIYDVNVAGVWMNESFRNQFAPVVREKGIDGLITTMAERNKGAGK
jgi:phospholipid transport system substrate-binding protein